MFLHRQDVIDDIDALFVHDEGGQTYFRPKGARHLLPVTDDRYHAVMDAVAFRVRRAMVATWIMGLATGAASIWAVVFRDDYRLAFALLGLNFLWSFMQHFSNGKAVLGPLIEEWQDSQRILSEP